MDREIGTGPVARDVEGDGGRLSRSDAPVFGHAPTDAHAVVRPSAYGLVTDSEGRVAVVRTAHGLFLPGGGIEAGETAREAVTREVREECGLDVQLGSWAVHAN